MALNFPSSPSTNDTYSYEGRTWTFNGNAWIQERFTSNLTLNISTAGNLIVGNTITSGDILPSANVTYNLGSDTYRWDNIYLAGNTTTTNMFVNSNAYITGNITTGNLITDSIFFSNGDPYVSGGGGGASNVIVGTRTTPVYIALASSSTLDIVGRTSNVTITLTT